MVIGMNTRTLQDDSTTRDGFGHPHTGLTSDVLPDIKASSAARDTQTGVSTRYVQPRAQTDETADNRNWYVLRTTYGREKKASEILKALQIKVFYPTQIIYKMVNGKRRATTASTIPNIFFAYDTFEHLKTFVYDNVTFSYLRFFYRLSGKGNHLVREPLVVPTKQMNDFIQICSLQEKDIMITTKDIPQFKNGQMVRIVSGEFAGIEGRIARYKRQQRVAVIIQGAVTAITAYVPTAYVEPLPTHR